MSKQEKIVCAAIKFAIQKEDYKGEKVVAGVDYKSIVDDGVLRYLAHPDATNIWKLGFLTNTNRFVDANEAEWVALKAGQLKFNSGNVVPYCDLPEGVEFLNMADFESGELSIDSKIECKEIGHGLKVGDLY